MDAGSKTNRIFVIDIARFYAIALVFYGHFIEELKTRWGQGLISDLIFFLRDFRNFPKRHFSIDARDPMRS